MGSLLHGTKIPTWTALGKRWRIAVVVFCTYIIFGILWVGGAGSVIKENHSTILSKFDFTINPSTREALNRNIWDELVSLTPTKVADPQYNTNWISQQAVYYNYLRWMRRYSRSGSVAGKEFKAKMEGDLRRIERGAFPFLKNTSFDEFRRSFDFKEGRKTKGLVIVCGDFHYRYLLHFLSTLRNVVKSDIPVEVFTQGNIDPPADRRKILTTKFGDVVVKNLLDVPLWDEAETGLKDAKWALKVFAMLSSEFSEPILCDADTIMFQDPYKLYDETGYKETGTLFYHDRWLQDSEHGLRSYLREAYNTTPSLTPSDIIKTSRYWTAKGKDPHNQESGVVLIDKSREDVLFSLMFVAWLNSERQLETLSSMAWGDKETFWFAFELTKQPYYFDPSYSGGCGRLERDDNNRLFTNNILHSDADGQPIWLNGGLLEDKNRFDSPWLEVDTIALGDGEWEWSPGSWIINNATWIHNDTFSATVREMTKVAQETEKKWLWL